MSESDRVTVKEKERTSSAKEEATNHNFGGKKKGKENLR